MMNNQGRPTAPLSLVPADTQTFTGNKALQQEEPLLFELDSPGACGVDLPELPTADTRLGALKPRGKLGLPSVAEPTVVRHFTRLSQKNFGIDSTMYPLGSCTMKHNPRLNERMA